MESKLSPEDEARLREAIASANIPTLLMVLVQLTGELRWLEDPYRPTRTRGLEDNDTAGLPEPLQKEIKEAAAEAIIAWRNGEPPAIPAPSQELLVDMMTVCMGETVPYEYAPMIAQELGVGHERTWVADGAGDEFVRVDDHGRPVTQYGSGTSEPGLDPESRKHRPKLPDMAPPPPGFEALIIGAGVSGLCAAVHFEENGIPYKILEKHDTVGGVWLENRYPGAGVDTPSHLYSFSFAPNDWTRYFAGQKEIQAYLERVADEFGIRQNIRFQREVVSATYDDDIQGWLVKAMKPDGTEETHRANVLISAVGAFNKPKLPNVRGLGTFEGPSVHTARWPEDLDLSGKRVAVIGVGASAMQTVPAIADAVGSMVIFQRSPQWAVPFEKFQKPVPEPIRFLLREVPLYYAWYRLRLAWVYNDKLYPSLQKDPGWPHQDRSLNPINDGHRRFFTRHMVSELGERQDLLPKVLPDYPPFGKRMLLDNGWFRTLTRENVELVVEGVKEVRPTGVVSESGKEYDADVLIWATGFDVVHFLAPMEVTGRSGRTIEEVWSGDDARAYLGTAIPDFPNFFCLYGPNTQFGHGGSLITVMERQMHYVMSVLAEMFARDIGVVEVRKDVHDQYNKKVDEAHENMVWTHPGMDTYYRNSRGRVVVNNPFRMVDYWKMTQHVDLDHYITEPFHAGRVTTHA